MENVFSALRNSIHFAKTLRVLFVTLMAVVSVNAWCAPEAAPKTPTPVAKTAAPKLAGTININTADAATLTELDGIGDAKANAIIDYRKQHGPFKSIEQLADVKGIGEKFIEKNRDRISIR
jgi:competence ComEA-like helix-hairpin-helix protein